MVLTRNGDKAHKLTEEFGVRTVVGSMEHAGDLWMITEEASKADIVIQIVRSTYRQTTGTDEGAYQAIVSAFDAIDAMLKGMEKRFEATGKKPILIYTVITTGLHFSCPRVLTHCSQEEVHLF